MDRVRRIISEVKEYGINNDVPIMSEDTIDTIKNIIVDNNIHSILEIGTAIAYSTICFASTVGVNKVTSIERDEQRYKIATKNVYDSGLSNIELIQGDALNTRIYDKYDMIIIDAAKSQNMRFFEKYKENLNKNGIIIIDNLSFHGYVFNSDNIKSRNLRQMVRKIERFIKYLDNQNEFDVKYIEVGDRLGVCKQKNF